MSKPKQDIEVFWQSTIPVDVWEKHGRETISIREQGRERDSRRLPSLTGGDFDQFDLHGVLGRGGMGVVHHATQASLQRKVAYKRLHDDAGPEKARILIQEGLVTGALDHPGIVPLHVLGLEEDGRPAFVMKQVDGVEWNQVIDHPEAHSEIFEDLEPMEFHVRVLMRICSAVHFAHERGAIHRDIKPSNVLLGRYDEVYLLDWGLAAAVDDIMVDRVPLARECKDVLGTPVYMAPEMARPTSGTIGIASDVYLLGASLFHALTGRPPHAAENLGLVLKSTQAEQPPTFPATVPSALAALCARALEPDPEQRYASADEFRRELARYLVKRSSFKLTTEASLGLGELIDWEDRVLSGGASGEETRIQRGLADVRFGFEQALHLWGENSTAQVGLREVLSFGVRTHVRHGDLAAADGLMRQIEEPEQALLSSVERLRTRVQEDAEQRVKDRQKLEDFDPSIGASSRAMASVLVPLSWALLLVLLHVAQVRGTPLSWELWLGQAAISIVIVLPVTFIGRRVFLGTRLNRSLSAGLYIALFGDLTLRCACYLLAIETMQSVPIVIGAHAIALGMLGIQIDRRMIPGSFLYLVASLLAAFYLEQSLLIFAATVLVSLGPMAIVWRPKKK